MWKETTQPTAGQQREQRPPKQKKSAQAQEGGKAKLRSLEGQIGSAEKKLADREARLADTRRADRPKRVAAPGAELDKPVTEVDAVAQDKNDSAEKSKDKPAAPR